ncbi:M20/M25/M40 family metallo-hydrolase [Amycolatopsis jejuensis]|uniref:M20/M25/M40 family metallo-hydrolase n=1 Tax=Amycolatopsis jejuensis TaxID=330084 RepID=UPI000689EBEA|nr:M20/M25/M40 family metallo-hydrolase [Amycolatopsis jejuensis]
MDIRTVRTTVDHLWRKEILPSLSGLVAIPALSPAFDPDWTHSGHLDAAVHHLKAWIEERALTGVTTEVVRVGEASPLLLVDLPATPGAEDQGTVLCYGHLDKQPPLEGWSPGLGPWLPVIRDGRLFGRGSADDGYAGYAAVTAVQAARAAGGRHARVVLLLETGEESGSPDLATYLDHLERQLGSVTLVLCLDSGARDHDSLWLTTSLRGLANLRVTVRVLDGPLHSGVAGGVVPCSFRILRELLGRIENAATGEILLPELVATIPPHRRAEARAAVAALGSPQLPQVAGMRLMAEDQLELVLNNSWRPALSVTGAAGLPDTANAGNVHRPSTTLALSLRLPPTVDSTTAVAALTQALRTDVPYGATVEIEPGDHASGWAAPPHAAWLTTALDSVAREVFSAPCQGIGAGGTIPFMAMLAQRFPEAEFVVTGAMDPHSRAHAPDESLHLGLAQRLTEAIAVLLNAHAARTGPGGGGGTAPGDVRSGLI